MLMNMYKRGSRGHTPLLNLCCSLELWPAVSQSVSEQTVNSAAAWPPCRNFLRHSKVGEGKKKRSDKLIQRRRPDARRPFFLSFGDGGTKDARTRKRRGLFSLFFSYESGTCAPAGSKSRSPPVHVSARGGELWCRVSPAEPPVRDEWQPQQSGGMILRRGPVLAAFLLCFLAKVRGEVGG